MSSWCLQDLGSSSNRTKVCTRLPEFYISLTLVFGVQAGVQSPAAPSEGLPFSRADSFYVGPTPKGHLHARSFSGANGQIFIVAISLF